MFASKEKAKKKAFREEALPHLDALYGVALRLIKHEKDAEDLVQDAYLKAYRHFDKYQQGTNCKAWLFKILTNTFINKYRKKQKEKTFLVDDEARPLYERHAAKQSQPLDRHFESQNELFHTVFGDEVREALEAIPSDFRMVVLLADLQDFSYKEIAEIVDCPIGTVMSRLYRGRRLLQQELVEYALERGVLTIDPRLEDDSILSLAEYRRQRKETPRKRAQR